MKAALWAASGYPSAEAQKFFGVNGTTTFWSTSGQAAITGKGNYLTGEKTAIADLAYQLNDAEMLAASINDFSMGESPEQAAKTTMESNYSASKYTLMNSINDLSSATQAYNSVLSDKNNLISYMGQPNYEKLLSDIKSMVNNYKFAQE